jgi:hypothetical protein
MSKFRTQRVIFRADVSVVIESPWDSKCSIDQVMRQAETRARAALAELRVPGVVFPPKPQLVRVVLDEGVSDG